jgi:hypothetical protein
MGASAIGDLTVGCDDGGGVRPMDDFHPAVGLFNQRRAAFDPIPVIAVQNAVDLANFGMVDMTADDAVRLPLLGLVGNGLFEATDEFNRVLHLVLLCQNPATGLCMTRMAMSPDFGGIAGSDSVSAWGALVSMMQFLEIPGIYSWFDFSNVNTMTYLLRLE